jgi:glycosyltransferase involved in cell wall biosynthesis
MRTPHDLTPIDRFQYTPTLSCVMPAYNEGKNLGTLVPQVLQALQALGSQVEIVLINDGSKDNTAEVIRQLCEQHHEVVGIDLSRNFGKEAALTAGIDAARGEVVVLMDSDGQHPVSLVAEMVQRWREGSDVVV